MNTYDFPILLKVQGRVKIFVNMVAASGLSPERENGTPSALQTGGTMIFLKKVRCRVTGAQICEAAVQLFYQNSNKILKVNNTNDMRRTSY
jgi:hypothetical protein